MSKSSKSAKSKVKAANCQENPLTPILSEDIFQNPFPYSFECRLFRQLPRSVQTWTIDLLSANMKEMYQQSNWGWDPSGKMDELSASTSWCLLAKKIGENQSAACSNSSENDNVGFVNFRYCVDYGFPVIYCYEIQIEKNEQGRGLGKRMLSILVRLARRVGMEKIVVTVFKYNQNSLAFFRRFGFKEDESNPSEDENQDYLILSFSIW